MSTRRRSQLKNSPKNLPRLAKSRLEMLVEEAIVDAYNESEQVSGFYTMLEENLKLPFETELLGVAVTVEKLDMTEDEQIVAICARAGDKQEIPILSLPLPSPPPAGWEWIAAYRYWRRGFE